MSTEQREAFLAEYEALCAKHDIIVAGCGCCESPFLTEMGETYYTLADHITHLRES